MLYMPSFFFDKSHRTFCLSALSLVLLPCFYLSASDADTSMEIVEVKGLSWTTSSDSDSHEQLRRAGVDFSAAGGVSALPMLNGMMGNPIKVLGDH